MADSECIKELEKMYSNKQSMSRHRQIQLMLQEFSLKNNVQGRSSQ